MDVVPVPLNATVWVAAFDGMLRLALLAPAAAGEKTT
jgi:hypothetical protein